VTSPSQELLNTQHKIQISMLSAGFETSIPAIKLPQTYALHRTATGISHIFPYLIK
jgi:hypothetical protein